VHVHFPFLCLPNARTSVYILPTASVCDTLREWFILFLSRKAVTSMPIPIDKLDDADYRLLRYMGQHEPVSEGLIVRHFSGSVEAIEYRLYELSKPSPRPPGSGMLIPPNESGYIEAVDNGDTSYRLTAVGRKALQDYDSRQKSKKRKEHRLAVREWITIAIALCALLVAVISLTAQLGLLELPSLK
jgi:hypothetical protein